MALRYLTSRRSGPVTVVTGLCTAGVLVGVGALVLALALMTGLQGDIKSRLLSSNPHVVVSPGWGQGRLERTAADRLMASALEHPDVLRAAPLTRDYGLLRSELVPGGLPVLVKGVDPALEDGVTGLAGWTTARAWSQLSPASEARSDSATHGSTGDGDEDDVLSPLDLRPPEPPAMLLGVGMAFQLGVTHGDVVRLVTGVPELSALGPVPRSRAYRIAGLLDTGLHEYDESWAVVGLDAHEPVDGVQLSVREPLRSARVAAELSDRLDGDLDIEDWTHSFSRLFAAFKWEKLIMVLALGLIGVVAGFNIFTILTMNVMARVADIGVMSALGARPGVIVGIFRWMGLFIGAAGTVAGVTLGAVAALLLDHFRLISLDPTVYLVGHVPFQVEVLDLLVVAGGMILVSLLATFLPARMAARLDPVVALREA